MEDTIDYISSFVNFITISALCFVIFFGNSLSSLLDIYENTNIVIVFLAFVVCMRCLAIVLFRRDGNWCSKSTVQSVVGSAFLLMVGVLLFHTSAVIYGAPLLEMVAETFYLSCLLTCTTLLPCCCVLGPDMSSWYKVLFKNCPDDLAETTVRMTTICSVIGAWVGAFPIPLDWDRSWQVWPISCVIGTALGHGAGLMLSPLQAFLAHKQSSKQKMR